ncbi:esterase/lipase [Trichoderma parareesei]|uniref:Esterase/lipase n=1 Tax=Trichoderma parareesei TaxID=858221 RepID=A0A2H2ZPH0_TRIPA|nr:esterase/lipase [Trichoderma parareesei]
MLSYIETVTPIAVSFPSFQLQIRGDLFPPEPGSPNRKGAAIVVSHPMTGVKEQTSTTYAKMLSNAGFFALVFDAGYQGESSGEPRGLEDPHQRVEDIKAAVSYLTALSGRVDPDRIGLLGICASGGYASYATQSDGRIKCLATVSAACVGRMTRSGGVHEEQAARENPQAIATALETAAQARIMAAKNPTAKLEAPAMFETDPAKAADNPDSFFRDAAAYYGSRRGKHERSTQRVPPQSYDLMVSYDSFNLQHLIAPRPLLMIAGSEAQTLHYSRTAIAIARGPKEMFVVPGRNHFDLYDNLLETAPKLMDFFISSLE